MADVLNLPDTFWIEWAFLLLPTLVLWLVVFSISRAHHRRDYRAWQGSTESARRQTVGRGILRRDSDE